MNRAAMAHASQTANRARRSSALLVTLAMVAAACSSGDDLSASSPDTPLDAVYAEIEGLDIAERQSKLEELAADEGTLSLYTIVNLDDTEVILDTFKTDTGIEVEVFRAKGGDLLQRVLEESGADRVGFDVLILSGPEMLIVDDEGILAPLSSPNTADIVASEVNTNWAGVYLNVFTAAWNTDIVAAGTEPASWEDVLTANPGALGLESGDFDWFATLVQDYFVADLGYSEAEAVDLFRAATDEGRVIDGHTVLTELLGAGEFDVVTSAYQHGVERLKGDGAPIDWQPAVEPLVIRSTGISIHSETETPATSLLFADWLLSATGQQVLASLFRTPANTKVQGGLGPDLSVLAIDIKALADSRDKWEPLYEELIRGS